MKTSTAINALTTLLLAVLVSGCATQDSPNLSAPSSALSFRDSSRAALTVEDQQNGRISAPAQGSSMQPLYGPNAYLVINPIEFHELKPGMLVAYKNLQGMRVVHEIVDREDGFWTVKGINNDFEDADYVTPSNLIGVVYGSFVAAH